jgi:hypothetical protein
MSLPKRDVLRSNAALVSTNRFEFARVCSVTPVIVGTHPLASNRDPRWSKVAWLLELLRVFDVVVWIDADAFVVKPECAWTTRTTRPIAAAYDQVMPATLNTGVVVARNDSLSLLRRVWADNDSGTGKSDQRSFNRVLKEVRAFEVLPSKYNAFPVPPRRCAHFEAPPFHDSQNVVVSHWAGRYGGGRVSDGRIVDCARRQLNLTRAAHALDNAATSVATTAMLKTAVLTVIA